MLPKEICYYESGLLTPLRFTRRVADDRARNICLSQLRTIGIKKEVEDAPELANRNLLLHKSSITAIDIDSQEWRYVLAGTADGSIYIHDLANFCGVPRHNSNLIATIKGDGFHREEVTSYQLSSRDIGSRERWMPLHLRRRGATSGLESEKSHGHSNSVTTVQWYPEDSGIFVTSGMDGTVKMWDANVLEKGPVEEFHLPYEKIFSHDLKVTGGKVSSMRSSSPLVAVASTSNHVKLIDLKSGSASHELRGHSSAIMTVKWSHSNENYLASGDRDGHLLLWDVRRARNCLKYFDFNDISKKSSNKRKTSLNLSASSLSREVKRTKLEDKTVVSENSKLTKLTTEKCVNPYWGSLPIAHNGSVNGVSFCDDGKHLISYGCHDGRIRKWDTISGINTKTKFPKLPPKTNAPNMCIKFAHTSGPVSSPGFIFVPSEDSIVMFDVGTGERVRTLNGHFYGVNCCVFNPCSQELISGGSDRNILIWEANQSQTEAYLEYLRADHGLDQKGILGSTDISEDLGTRDNWSSSSDEASEDAND